MSNPDLDAAAKAELVKDLMQARREVSIARRTDDAALEADARSRVQKAKVSLGERGPLWWDQREGDHNQRLVKNTPYASWFAALTAVSSDSNSGPADHDPQPSKGGSSG